MKLTTKPAELRIDMGDGAIDDHYVAGAAQSEDLRRRSSNNCVYDAPPWPDGLRAKDCFAALSLCLD
ncbi:hypothetical protein NKJ26_32550 [Mesorhizobium sp. M0152]|uniref:hypothetical protein n=1 Tax=Mesorhizobium sp. M0152 TaxID=2956898 RepID=UPI003335E606